MIASGGTRWGIWLSHCATSWKVAGSIPDFVSGIFQFHNSSGWTMTLAVDSASNNTEYLEYFLGGKGGRCQILTTLPHTFADSFEIWEPPNPGILRTCPGLYVDCFTSTYHCHYRDKELWWFDLQELQTQEVISYIAKNALFKLNNNHYI
jgi:hypothetical protein